MFDIGRYKEETMAFTPSVTVKDYTWAGSAGYINPKPGGTPARFKTIIQIVPNPPGARSRPSAPDSRPQQARPGRRIDSYRIVFSSTAL